MRDMACKLPSVFDVKLTENDDECILFEVDKLSLLKNKLNGLCTKYACHNNMCTLYIFIIFRFIIIFS